MRRTTAKAAALLATLRKAATGVGAPFVDVRHPHLERHDRHLEAEAGDQEHGRQQQPGAHVGAVRGDRGGDAQLAVRRHQRVVPVRPKRNAMP